MVAKTFTLAGGGSWETGANWTPTGVPGAADDASLTNALTGTYTVSMSATEGPNSITINDPTATLSVLGTGIVLGSPIALNAGTFALTGQVLGSTITAAGGVFAGAGGTLDGVTWKGGLNGGSNGTFYSVAIKDGITLLNAAGNAPGTLDISNLYTVNVVDAVPLNNIVINIGNFNNEYLSGSNSFALILGANGLITQTAAASAGNIGGAQFNNLGTVNAGSSGGSMYIGSTVFNNSGTLTISNGDHVTSNSGFHNTGTVGVSASGVFIINSNGTLTNTSNISVASAGKLNVVGNMSGAGTISLASFALADVHNLGGTVVFLDGKDTLRLETPATFTANLAGFQPGDKIDLPGLATTTLGTYSGNASGGSLPVLNNGTAFATLTLVGNYVGATFSIGTDGQTGNQITVACYAAGTRILTAAGEIAVEALREGDEVVILSGGAMKPIKWIGQSRIDLDRHCNPEAVAPVRIRAGAMAPGVPHRDLLVSPDHAILQGDVLVPAHCLVNGATIIREAPSGVVRYFHVELDRHDILLAEGLPAESYLDTGNRAAFANSGGSEMLHPCFDAGELHAQAWSTRACRTLVLDGPLVDAAHAALLNRAVAMGHARTEDAGLTVEADGAMLPVASGSAGQWSVRLPAGTRQLRLVSRAAVLDDRSLADGRRTGIPIAAIRLDGVALALDHPALAEGFHELEGQHGAQWRWTNGDARMVLSPSAAETVLEITGFTGWRSYWAAAEAAALDLAAVKVA